MAADGADRVNRPRRAFNTAQLAVLAAVERSVPFWPTERIERLQQRRLRSIVRHAYETVPFYREAMDERGLRPEDIRTVTDFGRLPIVEREQVQRDPEAFLSAAQPRDRYLKLRTSGSTGSPRDIYHDAAALLQNAAHGERDRSVVSAILGHRVGYRETNLASPTGLSFEVRRFVHDRILAPPRLRVDRQYVSLLVSPARMARQIDAFAPDVLHGYGSAIELLFAHDAAADGPRHRPQVITYSSDTLSAAARRTIEEDVGIPVFATYQAVEAFKIGFECERRRGYHLNVDLYPLRIVDESGRDLAAGETGEVVVSNLVNRATVLFNYRLGDLGTLASTPCPCGRSLPLLASLDGRCDDAIVLPSGRVVHPQAVRSVFNPEPAIWQYQIVQEDAACFRVAVVAAVGADRARLGARLETNLAERFGEPVTIRLAFVPAVERTAGGKVRTVVSWCRNGRISATAGNPRDD